METVGQKSIKIVVACDSFKDFAPSKKINEYIVSGLKEHLPTDSIISIKVADGGEGTAEALLSAKGGTIYRHKVRGPFFGEELRAPCAILSDGTGVVEISAASGIQLIDRDRRDPTVVTSYGTGQLMKFLLEKGVTKMIIGLGGSGVHDGGCGALQALGVKLLDRSGRLIKRGVWCLQDIASIDSSDIADLSRSVSIAIAADVTNPLLGENGAAKVFGPQKGAKPSDIPILEEGTRNLAAILEANLGKKIRDEPRTGAAGGFAAGIMGCFKDVELKSGIDLVLNTIEFESMIEGADLVITGEGKLDDLTRHGKCPLGIALRVQKLGIAVVAIVGSTGFESEEARRDVLASFTAVIDSSQGRASDVTSGEFKKVVGPDRIRAAARQIGGIVAGGRIDELKSMTNC